MRSDPHGVGEYVNIYVYTYVSAQAEKSPNSVCPRSYFIDCICHYVLSCVCLMALELAPLQSPSQDCNANGQNSIAGQQRCQSHREAPRLSAATDGKIVALPWLRMVFRAAQSLCCACGLPCQHLSGHKAAGDQPAHAATTAQMRSHQVSRWRWPR